MRVRSQPSPDNARGFFVCGSLGRTEPEHLRKLLNRDGRVRPLLNTPVASVWGSDEVVMDGAHACHWGELLEPSPFAMTTPDTASEDRVCAGSFVRQGQLSVYSDAFGLQPLYHRRSGDGLLFATRIGPLVECIDSPLNLDWEAWSTTLTLGAPLADKTPFREIRRWQAGERVVVDPGGKLRWARSEPSWLKDNPRQASVAELLDALRGGLPSMPPWRRPPAITLSGGWDSRIIAALARDKYWRKPSAWTTLEGNPLDVEYARSVANVLLLEQHICLPQAGSFPRAAQQTRCRVDFLTAKHAWLEPLAQQLRAREARVFDGLAGDVLIKALFLSPGLLEPAHPQAQMSALFQRLGGLGPAAFRDNDCWLALSSGAAQQFAREADRFIDHHNALTLTILMTRTARVVGPSPMALFYPELRVITPFLAPEVVRLALSIPARRKLKGALYRELLDLGCPSVARLPSTNDGPPPSNAPPPDHYSLESIRWMAGPVCRDPIVCRLLPPPLLQRLQRCLEGGAGDLSRVDVRALMELSLLAQWRAEYGHLLHNWDELPG